MQAAEGSAACFLVRPAGRAAAEGEDWSTPSSVSAQGIPDGGGGPAACAIRDAGASFPG